MKLVVFGDFYFGIDKESFFDLQLHLGRFRVEWVGPLALTRETDQETMHRCSSGEDSERI